MTMISPIGQLGILLTRADEQDRTSALQMENAADQAAMRDANDRVAQLRAKADADRDSALATGLGEIAEGACSVGAGFVPASNSSASGGSPSAGANHGMDWIATLGGGGKALRGVGDVIGGVSKGEADRDEAEAARFDAQAQADTRRYERAQSDEQATNEAMQKVEQFVDQTQQAQNAARLAAATFRG
jgi:hypothetical protein